MLGVIWAVFRGLVFLTTELALTNKRVIAKSGIIRRNVIDVVSNTKVEGVSYNQGIIGRIFGYGSVLVRGTGVARCRCPSSLNQTTSNTKLAEFSTPSSSGSEWCVSDSSFPSPVIRNLLRRNDTRNTDKRGQAAESERFLPSTAETRVRFP